ncbi:MAG: GrpB family protein [Chloroflexi bacterium]|nr:GrpB family protein [Chloroflexota bacterium]
MTDFNPNESFELAPYNPEWPELFARESVLIADVIGEAVIEIEHIGSTSVPGLAAKPIIDIMLVVESFAPIEEYRRRLEPLGYHHHSHEDDADRLFFWKGMPRTHHLHIVEYATWEHQRHILFRDYLRTHPDIARLYEEIKRELSGAFHHNRPAYTKGKTAFIKSIMARAVEEIRDPSLRTRYTDPAAALTDEPSSETHDQ